MQSQRPLRILFHHRIASRDGQAVHMEELVAALRRQGHSVSIVGPALGTGTDVRADGGWVEKLRNALPPAVTELMELAYNGVAAARLLAALLRERPDAVYERYNLFTPAGVWLARALGYKVLLEVNAPLAAERAAHGGLCWKRLAAWTERATWRAASRVLPVTQALAAHVHAAGVPADRVTVIPNGADLARLDRLDRAAAKSVLGLEGKVVLGFTGFLRPWHGLEGTLEVLAGLAGTHPVHLLVLGEGPARADLEAKAAELGISDRVTFAGLVGRADVPRYLAAMDVALQPDCTDYASPLKLFEYMALGLAILAPDKPNLREILADGESALLVPPGDIDAQRAALLALCADRSLRERLGAGAKLTLLLRDLTWDGNAKRVADLATGGQDRPLPLPRNAVVPS